ncbi:MULTISPECIES: hypothetical protein [unclassified Synechocystis]|uniref:hypothetical protein n=1 Tax=unclassified Synechocystis TaxID=2640012 RepID=UPI00040A562A|nr:MULTISPECIES: hypothetical protein [unclassified Synechocystis]AIE75887.1 hypothetical protein D082_33590 [Synechocystis sp. PCC 6714]MCT0255187.1 hypothetical protein [Synechocystis sp. CS-94]
MQKLLLGKQILPAWQDFSVNLINSCQRQLLGLLSLGLICFCLNACQNAPPPLEFAPDGAVVQQAINFQLNRTQTALSQHLNAPTPDFEISKINVKKIEAIAVDNLPAYHLAGGYDLKLILPRQTVIQKQNPFELYLQRQSEGKSWRLLKKDIDPRTNQEKWGSYLVELEGEGTDS